MFLWSPFDWGFALDTPMMHAAFCKGDLMMAAELRLRAEKMGLTCEDRMKLRIRYVGDQVDPPDPFATRVVDLWASRSSRVGGLLALTSWRYARRNHLGAEAQIAV